MGWGFLFGGCGGRNRTSELGGRFKSRSLNGLGRGRDSPLSSPIPSSPLPHHHPSCSKSTQIRPPPPPTPKSQLKMPKRKVADSSDSEDGASTVPLGVHLQSVSPLKTNGNGKRVRSRNPSDSSDLSDEDDDKPLVSGLSSQASTLFGPSCARRAPCVDLSVFEQPPSFGNTQPPRTRTGFRNETSRPDFGARAASGIIFQMPMHLSNHVAFTGETFQIGRRHRQRILRW